MSADNTPFTNVCKLDDLSQAVPKTFEVNDRFVVLVRYDDDVFCVEDLCTHDGGTLGDGELEGHCLICPRHGAKFDVRTGEAVSMPATEPTNTFDVKIEGDDVLVRVA
jgi:3-phenylpropionate/trans-cinnamate dioxygenase ferredoxin subunit